MAEAVWRITNHILIKPCSVCNSFSSFTLFITWLLFLFLWILFCTFIDKISKTFGSWRIYICVCFCMYYRNKNIPTDTHIKTGFSWFMESILQILLHVGFLSKEFFDNRFSKKKAIVCNLFFKKNLQSARCSFVAKKMYQKHILL